MNVVNFFPKGVASGDPDDTAYFVDATAIRPGRAATLTVEVARDADFRSVVARARAPVLAEADWTCRVLVGGLLPATTYWYRFTDNNGEGSRVGRTITAPTETTRARSASPSCRATASTKARRMPFAG